MHEGPVPVPTPHKVTARVLDSTARGARPPITVVFLRAIAYATPIPSVCPSVTRVYCIKTAERIIEIHSPSDRPIILVFRHQGSLCKSEGVTPNGGAKNKG